MSNALAIVLAAGKGTRMKSDLPKVLCEVCGRPMIDYVLDAITAGGIDRSIVVVGYRADDVRAALSDRGDVIFVEQTQQLGTGHAAQVCREHLLRHEGPVLILAGDSPMVQRDSISRLLAEFHQARPACILGTLHRDDPHGLGRIVRDANGNFLAIVEEKDATPVQRKITEVNMSTYVFDCAELVFALDRLSNDNQQGEFYLTDCPGILRRAGKAVLALPILKPCEAMTINTVEELAAVEAELRKVG